MQIPKKYISNQKKNRLIKSAKKLFYENGVSDTTLANIASLAEIPLGNVYYYFKSKDSIILSVIEFEKKLIKERLKNISKIRNVKDRLKYFIYIETKGHSSIVKYGDEVGSLAQALCKKNNAISRSVANLMKDVINWCIEQFNLLDKGNKSTRYAIILVANIQGLNLLNSVFKNYKFSENYSDYLINWIEEII